MNRLRLLAGAGRTSTGGHGGPEQPPWLPEGFRPDGPRPRLAAGGAADVWQAVHVRTGHRVALKVWHGPLSGQRQLDLFQREIQAHRLLAASSGHIVAWVGAGRPRNGRPWLGTALHGRSLREVLDQLGGRPDPRLGVVLGLDLVRGLAAVHDRGFVHRDVKPSNVLVRDGRAVLCDLGLAMLAGNPTVDALAGTIGYLAPELAAGKAEPSQRTDVYSAAQVLREVLGDPAPYPAIERLLRAAGSDLPADRPGNAQELAARLAAACDVADLTAPRPLPPDPDAYSLFAGAGADPAPLGRRWRPPPRSGAPQQPDSRQRRRVGLPVAAAATLLAAVALTLDRVNSDPPAAAREEPTAPADAQSGRRDQQLPDAALADPDITTDGRPVVLPPAKAGRCNVVLPDAIRTGDHPYSADGTVVATVQAWYSPSARQACAKLVKPPGSPYAGIKSHLALTLCGDENSCDHDWNAYPTDAGPAVVPSRTGCISWRVSMLDDTSSRWLIRDDVQSLGCS